MSLALRKAARRLGTRQTSLACTCASYGVATRLQAQLHSAPCRSSRLPAPRVQVTRRTLATVGSSTVSQRGPTAAYDQQVAEGIIVNDEHQRGIVALLQEMFDKLETYTPPPIGPLPPPTKPSLLTRISRSRFFSTMEDELHQANTATIPLPPAPRNLPKGLYLYGSVGCGKSFLMDLFYANLPPKYEHSKRRVHFHAFMMDVHRRGHKIKMESGEAQDWIVLVARQLAQESRVLCFDEFQVTDIADAMILRRLMEALHAYGVVCITTSNRAPDDLYKNGIQREQFLPCIELIKDAFVVKCLDSDIDYRKRPRALSKVYFDPIDEHNRGEITKLFESLAGGEEIIEHRPLAVWGRQINVPLSTPTIAMFKFLELCGKPLSAADYLEITKTFDTIFLVDVPQLGLDTKDQARRFILFIDAAYEAKTKLFVLSDPPITTVFSDEKPKTNGEITAHQRSVMDDLGLSFDVVGASSIFTGDEEVFAFARALSRLNEMSGVQWSQTSKMKEVVH